MWSPYWWSNWWWGRAWWTKRGTYPVATTPAIDFTPTDAARIVIQVRQATGGDARVAYVDFADFVEVASGETISNAAVTCDDVTLIITGVAVSGTKVIGTVSGMIAGTRYTLTFACDKSGGGSLERSGYLDGV